LGHYVGDYFSYLFHNFETRIVIVMSWIVLFLSEFICKQVWCFCESVAWLHEWRACAHWIMSNGRM